MFRPASTGSWCSTDKAYLFDEDGDAYGAIDSLMNAPEPRPHHEIAQLYMSDSRLVLMKMTPFVGNKVMDWAEVTAPPTWDPKGHYRLYTPNRARLIYDSLPVEPSE